MKYQIASIVVGLLIAGIIGWSVYEEKQDRSYQYQPTTDSPSNNTTTESTNSIDTSQTTDSPAEITLSTVNQHNSATSCWSTINGKVYDLTSWIPNHPGGEQAILQLCGTDGTAKFNQQHGGQQKQLNILVGFEIGTLTN